MTDKIIINSIKCKTCGDICTSKHTHDFRECSCPSGHGVHADGGLDYLKRGYPAVQEGQEPSDFYYELSIVAKRDGRYRWCKTCNKQLHSIEFSSKATKEPQECVKCQNGEVEDAKSVSNGMEAYLL